MSKANDKSLLNRKPLLLPKYTDKTFSQIQQTTVVLKVICLKSGFVKTWNRTYANTVYNSDHGRQLAVKKQKNIKY